MYLSILSGSTSYYHGGTAQRMNQEPSRLANSDILVKDLSPRLPWVRGSEGQAERQAFFYEYIVYCSSSAETHTSCVAQP